MNKTKRNAPSLDEIEEYETAQWLGEQLDRIERLVREHGNDDEMLEAISLLREESSRWVAPDSEDLARSGRLSLSNDDGNTH